MPMRLCLCFILSFLTHLRDAKNTLPTDEKTCTSQWEKSNLLKRFTTSQIQWMCKQQANWKQMLRRPFNDAPRLTKRQSAYLDFISSCKGTDCKERFPSDEEETTGGTNPQTDPRCKWPKKEWKPKSCSSCRKKACSNDGRPKKGKRQALTGGPSTKILRKEYRTLTEEERNRLHTAFNQLKSSKVDGVSKYDLMTSYHYTAQAPGAHWGPAFLPWHREYLKRMETALRNEVPDAALAFWDSTMDYGLPDARDSVMWTPPYMGNGNGYVRTGPFANWAAATPLPDMENVSKLYRSTGGSPLGDLFRPSDVEWLFARKNFSQLTACVDPTFELVHGLPHVWVGGYMLVIRVSPNDPIFYLHHTYLDYLWEQFRRTIQNANQRTRDWAPSDKLCEDAHKFDGPMSPFEPLKNRDGLSEQYTAVWYDYVPGPDKCSRQDPDCRSPVLWCDFNQQRCRAKIRLSGNCTGLQEADVCYQSVCGGSVCVQSGARTRWPNLPDESARSSTTTSTSQVTTRPPAPTPPFPQPTPPFPQPSPPPGRASIPNGYYQTPAPAPQSVYEYIKTVMVDENGPVDGGVVTAEGLDYDGSSKANALTQANAVFPETPGVVYVKIRDPTLKRVTVKLSAKDSSGQPCNAYCARAPYGSSTSIGSSDVPYTACNGTLALSSQMDVSDPIPYTKIDGAKRFLGADLQGHPSTWTVKSPFLCFMCNGPKAASPGINQRVFNDLVGSSKLNWNSSDHVWFHVLVLDGRVPYHRGVPDATVIVTDVPYAASIVGKNRQTDGGGGGPVAMRSGNSYETKVTDDHAFPRYFGVASIKARNPKKTATGRVQLLLRVLDETGRQCQPRCGQEKTTPCTGHVVLSTDAKQSDAFSFSPLEQVEPYLNWDLSKHPSRWHAADSPLQFVCYS